MGILSNFIFHTNFSYCLTCKKVIGGSNDYKNAFTHAVGIKHLKTLRGLFRTWLADPFSNCSDLMYLQVVRGAKLDISQLLQTCNEKNYVYEKNGELICHVCQETVSDSTDVHQIKKDLFHHLNVKGEAHTQIMKDKASWTYNFPNCFGYLSFENTIVFCSVCSLNVGFEDSLKLHAAVGHLHTSRHNIKAQEEITQIYVLTKGPKAQGSDGLGISAPGRNNSATSQNLQKPPRHPINTNLWEYDSIKKLIANPSLAPHVQFLEFKGNTFMCTLCNVSLTISLSKSFNLEEHILGSTHKKLAEKRNIIMPNGPQIKVVNKQFVLTSPQMQIDKLSQEAELSPHVKYLQIEGDLCRCAICDVYLTVSVKVNDNLKAHILGAKHQKKFAQIERR